MSKFRILITSRPCGMTDKLLAIVPTIEKAYPGVTIETNITDEGFQEGDGFPQTKVVVGGRTQAILYGFRSENQHIHFLSSILDSEWSCERLAS
jgi:hypothetical protein